MGIKIIVIVLYFSVVLIIGFIARTRWRSSPESYFLADRSLGTAVLLGTMAATNFSAFTVFGASGAGYRDGYAFFPIMGFGTGFMAISFWLIGRKIWSIGKKYGIITPPEMIRIVYRSPALSFLFATVMIVFTLPYLALQPMAAGYALEELLGLPYFYGCVLVTAVIAVYTLWGGMRSVAWTDLFQGVLMAAMLLVSLVLVLRHHGGFFTANAKLIASFPELFARPGGQGKYTLEVWFSFMMLWFFCDPMFPQLFQRFFSAKSERTISKMMLFYPLVCTVIFFMPIAVGVAGHLSFPGLEGKQADRILPMMIDLVAGDAVAALVITCGIAALMSTMDSQLLTLSSIFTLDISPMLKGDPVRRPFAGRIFVIALSILGLALAYRPPATILQIATETFTGLAVLFPTVLFGLYLKKPKPLPAILSIIAGETAVILYYFQLLPAGGFLSAAPVILLSFASYGLCHGACLLREGGFRMPKPAWMRNPHLYSMLVLFLLSMDFWAWDKTGPYLFGIPFWWIYFVLLSGLQTILMMRMIRSGTIERSQYPPGSF
ncbi:MAG: sodium:solute symporter family protein [Desulfobacteraceae bacterium]|nr:MAG: sodium:solute symporter family protein [Desulfobacteraceae bacterium]